MSDRYHARIMFPAALIDEEIKAALEGEGVEFNDQGLLERPDEVWIEDGIFHLDEPQAAWGMFSDLEDLLQGKGIPFDRESEAYYDFSPEKVVARPSTNIKPAMRFWMVVFDGSPMVKVEEIKNLLPQGIEALQAYLDQQFPEYPPLAEYVKED